MRLLILLLILSCTGLAGCSSDEGPEQVSFERLLNSSSDDTEAEEGAEGGDEEESEENENKGIQLDTGKVLQEGIYIDNVYVGGVKVRDAREELMAAYEEACGIGVSVYWDSDVIQTNLGELGLYWGIDEVLLRASVFGTQGSVLRQYKFHKDVVDGEYHLFMEKRLTESAVTNFLRDYITASYKVDPVNAEIEITGSGFHVTEDKDGIDVDYDKTWKLLQYSYAESSNHEPIVIQAVKKDIQAKYQTSELETIQDLLGSAVTDYATNGNQDRSINVETATKHISGTIVLPGESKSTSELMLPRTEENGYRGAGTQVSGTIEDTLGGGICQASTTLYNALLKAEVQIDVRYPHSMKVNYVDPAKDAAITEDGYKDLIFTNNRTTPIYIYGYTDGQNVSFFVYGTEDRPSNRTISFESVTTFEQVYEEGGVEIDAYLDKVIYIDGVETDRIRLHNDHYEPSSRLNGTIN